MSKITRRALIAVLSYLYSNHDGSAEACNLWEQVHAALGCEECIAKWPMSEHN
jgi:hypothetical protein